MFDFYLAMHVPVWYDGERKKKGDSILISYIKGPLVEVWEDMVVVEAGGIGYNIHVPVSVIEALPGAGREVQIYTSLQVREDAMTLYGFLSRQDLQMFKQLLGVNGIGPKAALGILSVMGADDLRMAILSGDSKAISRAPGVGSKTAQRVILDLKDKIHMEDILLGDREEAVSGTEVISAASGMKGAGKEAVEALVALGYSLTEAGRAVRQVEITEAMTAEDVLKASLRYLAF